MSEYEPCLSLNSYVRKKTIFIMNIYSISRFIVTYVLVLLLGACMSGPRQEWPAQLPNQQVFEAAFVADQANGAVQTEADYLLWVKRFYLGWALYPNGWEWLTATVLDATPDALERDRLRRQMAGIGQKIGSEWAKDSQHRSINTSHLIVWGNAVRLAVKDGSQAMLADKIGADVDELRAQALRPSQIEMDRYFPESSTVASQALEDEVDPFDI